MGEQRRGAYLIVGRQRVCTVKEINRKEIGRVRCQSRAEVCLEVRNSQSAALSVVTPQGPP
tara:strand:- start:41859 stop:42041 length:183 start_codon:yes stop_codon:yes gene_type:complete